KGRVRGNETGFGVSRIRLEHFKTAVAGHIGDLDQVRATLHRTGHYPDWWRGRRFNKPTIGWGAGTTNETTRDTVQRILVGRTGRHGTGSIPKDPILGLVPPPGTPDLLVAIH